MSGNSICGATLRGQTADWSKVTCPACLQQKPKTTAPAAFEFDADEMAIAMDAIRVWIQREKDMMRHDCWGDTPGQVRKRAAYQRRINIANRMADQIAKKQEG